MSLGMAENESRTEIHLPGDVNWEMLDKSKFFFLGAALFSGVSGTLYPTVVLKTRQQVVVKETPCFKMAVSILKHDGFRGFYRGFGTSLMGTIPARSLYMGALEITKSSVGYATVNLGYSEAKAAAVANAAAGVSAAVAAQVVWTPIDVVSQRLMVQGVKDGFKYNGGIDAFRQIVCKDGIRGLYRGFGLSIVTYAPSNAVWWASYSLAHRAIWDRVSSHLKKYEHGGGGGGGGFRPDLVAVQAASAAMASGVSVMVTMPLDTIKTRLQVLDCEGYNGKVGLRQTLRKLINEGGLSACYRGLGPRWISVSMSTTIMVTTYEFLKKLSTKSQDCCGSLQ
ncbi:uncharacterized protein LOC143586543 [Bidens hawaiensis]|uniref:uncharacterized protein LOC143586543 n=1 Tax=Bidens hawaiensis TaxID=980011 RepID=UPI00404B5CDD